MTRRAGWIRRATVVALALGAASLAPASASASITFGSDLSDTPIVTTQTCAPAPNPCTDMLLNVNAGNPYPAKSPTDGTVTAFGIRSGSADTVTFRLVSFAPGNSSATGAGTGPTVTLPGPGTHMFPTNLPITHGTYLGINTSSNRASEALPCTSTGAALLYNPVLTDGGPFEAVDANSICELLIQAVVEPSNAFKVGKLKLNKKRGTGTLKVTLPGPGDLIVAGKNVQAKQAKAIGTKVKQAGPVTMKVKPVGRGRKKMRNNGKLSSKLKLTFSPTGGTQSVRRKKVTLKQK